MSTFDFLSVLFSVVIGLALTEVLQDFRDLIHARHRVKFYWPAMAWGALMILIVAQAWWGMFAMRDLAHWNFAMYGAVVLQITLMYLAAGVVLPDVPEQGPFDMRAAYYGNSRWFFGMLAATVLSTFLKDFVLIGHMTTSANVIFLAIYFFLSLIAAYTKKHWFHAFLAPATAVALCTSAAFLSFNLQG
jgi:hypothetical protein